MERIVQLLDDLDDFVAMFGLVGERIRAALLALTFGVLAVALPAGCILLALAHPPLALATAILLFVSLLYHSVTSPTLEIRS